MIHVFVDFISGMCVGLELFTGEDLEIGDKFAMQIDLLIIRFTFVFR
jgi:hypothetical protein